MHIKYCKYASLISTCRGLLHIYRYILQLVLVCHNHLSPMKDSIIRTSFVFVLNLLIERITHLRELNTVGMLAVFLLVVAYYIFTAVLCPIIS